jgi:hypothetical protein
MDSLPAACGQSLNRSRMHLLERPKKANALGARFKVSRLRSPLLCPIMRVLPCAAGYCRIDLQPRLRIIFTTITCIHKACHLVPFDALHPYLSCASNCYGLYCRKRQRILLFTLQPLLPFISIGHNESVPGPHRILRTNRGNSYHNHDPPNLSHSTTQ